MNVVNVRDGAGDVMATPAVVSYDPTRANFPGTPPAAILDTDKDGVSDAKEVFGFTLSVKVIDGTGKGEIIKELVTSDPLVPDNDGDGLKDNDEFANRSDPRDSDTDDDLLPDFQELIETGTSMINQDSDGDGLIDSTEWDFYRTNPTLPDTDGDKILDGDEVLLANRNPRVADVPKPSIEIGNIDLRIDERFTATNGKTSRTLDSKSVQSTLVQSNSKTISNTDSETQSAYGKVGVHFGTEVGATTDKLGTEFTWGLDIEGGWSGEWTSTFTEESTQATQSEATEGRTTDVEKSEDESVTREVLGASMKVALSLKALGNVAFNLKNLEVTALVEDPAHPGELIPVASLKAENPLDSGYNLGPLVAERGPFVFVSDKVYPKVVDELMSNPRALVFKVANFDIEDESQRKFNFASQDINDRTAPLVIDYGGADTDGDKEGDFTERYNIATNSGRVIDLDGDGVIDESESHRVAFDRRGKAVGMTLRDAMECVLDLKFYDEDKLGQNTASLTASLKACNTTRLIAA